jgi:hypothetical protein
MDSSFFPFLGIIFLYFQLTLSPWFVYKPDCTGSLISVCEGWIGTIMGIEIKRIMNWNLCTLMCVSHFWLKMLLKWKPIFFLWTELIIRNLNYTSHRNGSYNIDILYLIRFCTREIFLCINWAFNSNSTEGNFEIANWRLCHTRAFWLCCDSPWSIRVSAAGCLSLQLSFHFLGFHFKLLFIGVVVLSTA